METPTPVPAQPAQEAPASPPTPQAGGSYLHDPDTGEFTLVHRTQDRDESSNDKAQE